MKFKMSFTRAIFGKGIIFTAGNQFIRTQPIATITTSCTPNFITSNMFKKMRKTQMPLAQMKLIPKFQSTLAQTETSLSAIQLKPRSPRKTRTNENLSTKGVYNVSAFSTAEKYDLEALLRGLNAQDLYETKKFFSTDNLGMEADVLYVTAKYKVDEEIRDIFFFREGSVVLWNFNETETNNILSFLQKYEKDGYLRPLVKGESEIMPYKYLETNEDVNRAIFKNGTFLLKPSDDNFLHKYTFSNAMATSIKLGIWEATLDNFIDSIEYLTEDLRKGRRIRISRPNVLRKIGELFALRHRINLSSDLLDTPDFYWDREDLETLYSQVCTYFSISRRTKVMNTKINHCVELAELISHNLNDAHHIRLEWMIIILIMVEVAFETIHYIERAYTGPDVEHIQMQRQTAMTSQVPTGQHKQIPLNAVG